LCSIVADSTAATLRQIRPAIGKDVEVLALSIDPNESVQAGRNRLNEAVHRYGDPDSVGGWHYVRGSEASIRAITDAAGFHFVYDPTTKQYAHPSGFIVLTPGGVISRYFLGVDFDPTDAAKAIARAANGRTGEPVFDLLLRCFQGDGIGGVYGRAIQWALAVGVILTVSGLVASIAWMLRSERRRDSQMKGVAP
jgi:protein SCO1/2